MYGDLYTNYLHTNYLRSISMDCRVKPGNDDFFVQNVRLFKRTHHLSTATHTMMSMRLDGVTIPR